MVIMNDINYWDHLHTGISADARSYVEANSEDPKVFQYRKRGPKEILFLDTADIIIHRDDRPVRPIRDNILQLIGSCPYKMLDENTMIFGSDPMSMMADAGDLALTLFTLRSMIARPLAWVHRKLRADSYEDVDLDEFGQELDKHGGIDFLQVISPPRAGKTDYIRCADGHRYVLDKEYRKVLRI